MLSDLIVINVHTKVVLCLESMADACVLLILMEKKVIGQDNNDWASSQKDRALQKKEEEERPILTGAKLTELVI